MLSWEKPLVKPMAPGSIFHHIIFLSIYYSFRLLFCNLYFPIYIIKIPKIFILSYLSDLTLISDREGLDNPFIALVVRFLFVCVGTRWLAHGLLLDRYLGSQKLREILTLLYCTTLSSSRENQRSAQEVARRIYGAVVGEDNVKSRHTKYPSQLLSLALHYLPFASRFLSPTSPLPFLRPSSVRPFVCLCYHVPSFFLHLRLLKVYGSSPTC